MLNVFEAVFDHTRFLPSQKNFITNDSLQMKNRNRQKNSYLSRNPDFNCSHLRPPL